MTEATRPRLRIWVISLEGRMTSKAAAQGHPRWSSSSTNPSAAAVPPAGATQAVAVTGSGTLCGRQRRPPFGPDQRHRPGIDGADGHDHREAERVSYLSFEAQSDPDERQCGYPAERRPDVSREFGGEERRAGRCR